MLSLDSLKAIANGMKADVANASAMLTKLEAEIAQAVDETRTADYQRAKTKEIRDRALPALGEIVRGFDQKLTRVVAQRRFYENRPLILSLQRFDANPVNDATIRQRWIAELAGVGPALLAAIADNAKDEGNLPVLWQCILAAGGPANRDGKISIPIDDLALPASDEGLALIAACEALTWTVHNIFACASGNPPTGAAKLAAARAQAALQPARTTHNSAGRQPPAAS